MNIDIFGLELVSVWRLFGSFAVIFWVFLVLLCYGGVGWGHGVFMRSRGTVVLLSWMMMVPVVVYPRRSNTVWSSCLVEDPPQALFVTTEDETGEYISRGEGVGDKSGG